MYILAIAPKAGRYTALVFLATSVSLLIACAAPAEKSQVEASYDQTTGHLRQLTINSPSDGKPNVTSYMDGTKFVRIEVDSNEDGKTDRWEYYEDGQKLSRVGLSRANDGTEDAWAIRSADGSLERVEISTRRNGKPNRTEFYERGALTRAEEDVNLDGRLDRWERYESGVLVSASFDTTNSGLPTTTIDYRNR